MCERVITRSLYFTIETEVIELPCPDNVSEKNLNKSNISRFISILPVVMDNKTGTNNNKPLYHLKYCLVYCILISSHYYTIHWPSKFLPFCVTFSIYNVCIWCENEWNHMSRSDRPVSLLRFFLNKSNIIIMIIIKYTG